MPSNSEYVPRELERGRPRSRPRKYDRTYVSYEAAWDFNYFYTGNWDIPVKPVLRGWAPYHLIRHACSYIRPVLFRSGLHSGSRGHLEHHQFQN
eukprot:4584026-Pyramimonas_sp.AAC.1